MSNQIVKAFERGAQKMGKAIGEDAGKAVKKLYEDAGKRLKKVADNHVENDARQAAEMDKILKGGPREDLPREPGGSGTRTSAGEEPSLAGTSRPGQSSEGNGSCTTGGDPVDVVSGQMITSATDLALPGLLPLVLRRSYASGYRGGRHFGPGWSSTLDQRVQIDARAIHYAGDDGQILHYPRPTAPGLPVLPEHGARSPLTWDDATGTIRIEDPATGWTRHFEAPPDGAATRPITALTDRNGHRVTYTHDADGLPTAVEHSGGYRVAVDILHTGAGPRIEALRLLDGTGDGLGTTVVGYRYDVLGRLSGIVNSSGLPLVYSHDAEDRITSWTDRNGHWYEYEYGPDGRVIRGVGSGGALEALFDYDLQDRTTTVTNSLGRRTRHHYDDHGHLTTTVGPTGGTVRTEHDPYGRLLSRTDELGRTTRYTLSADGDPVRVDRPDDSTLTATYNTLRLPLEVTAPDGATWRHAYDPSGNRTETTDPAAAVTRYGYDEAGRVTTVTDALGRTSHVRCDAAGLIVETVDALGGRSTCLRDAFGRTAAETDAMGNTTRYTWTVEGRPLSRTTPDGATETWTYDAEGNALTHTDRSGAVRERAYASFGRLTATTGPDGVRHTFAYDTELQLTEVTDQQGLTWTYEHDPAGRVAAETDFNGRTLTYTHDEAGRLLSRTNGLGQRVGYAYDLAGNVVTKVADGQHTTYVYDSGDRLIEAAGPEVRLSRSYDVLGRLLAETVNGRTVSSEYDPTGRRVSRRTPSGSTSHWTHDAAGRPSSLIAAGHTLRFDRDALGRETTRHLGDGLTLSSTWDSLSRLTAQSLTGAQGGPAYARSYDYRPDGHLVGITDERHGTRRLDLDAAGRVTAVQGPDWTETYAYDDLGNLAQATWPGRDSSGQGPRTYRGTLIASAGAMRYEHDAQGRVTTRRRVTLSGRVDVWRFGWDAEDRLTTVTTPRGEHWHYLYDPFGRRVAKRRLTGSGDDAQVIEWIDFTWDATTLAEQSAHGPGLPGAYTITWDHQGLRPIAQTELMLNQEEFDRRFFAIVTDLIGAPTHLVDPDGGFAWQADLSLWGATAGPGGGTGATHTPLRFPGQYHDPETALNYNVHRYYDPVGASYLSPDPLGLLPAPNPHAYVGNPLAAIDPLGLAEQPPLGEHSNPFPTRGDAERAAFGLAGVPYGTPHDAQWHIGDDVTRRGSPGYVYDTEPTHWGEMRQFETPEGSRVVVEHTGDPAGPHFHAGMPKGRGEDATREGVNFGWDGTDPVKDGFERYQKIDKPGGDHHLFYRNGSQCPG